VANEKILIVEDEATMRTLLTVTLEGAGYQVIQAEDGDAGYQMAKTAKPDLIISDILMPQMDGNELMKRLRESEFGKQIPFMVVSARSQMKDYFEMMNADGFISKPYDAEQLLSQVASTLTKYGKKRDEQAASASGEKKKKILLLDNEEQEYDKYKKILMDNKFEVSITKTLAECVDSANNFRPDLVAIRFIIDQMNGDKMVKSLKEIPNIAGVPVVVYSRKIRGWEEKKVKDAGASAFLGEVTDEKLLEVVKKTVE